MNVYSPSFIITIYLIQLIISCLLIKSNKKYRTLFLITQVIFMSFYFGSRNINIGSDTVNYVRRYFTQSTNFEIGLVIVNRLIYFIAKDNFNIYLTIMNFILLFNLSRIIKELCNKNVYLNLIFTLTLFMPYIILMNVNILRQGIALSFIILGLVLFFIKSKKNGLFYIIFGSLLHYSMIVFVVVFFIVKKLRIDTSFYIFVFILFIYLNLAGISEFIILNFPITYIRNRFFHYMEIKSSVSFFVKFLFYFGNYLLIRILTLKKNEKENKLILDIFTTILFIGSLIMKSELSSMRFLLIAEVLIPIFYINQADLVKEKVFFIVSIIFFISAYFIIFVQSYSYSINFLV